MVYIVKIITNEVEYPDVEVLRNRKSKMFTTYHFSNSEDAAAFMDVAVKHVPEFVGATMEIIVPAEEVF